MNMAVLRIIGDEVVMLQTACANGHREHAIPVYGTRGQQELSTASAAGALRRRQAVTARSSRAGPWPRNRFGSAGAACCAVATRAMAGMCSFLPMLRRPALVRLFAAMIAEGVVLELVRDLGQRVAFHHGVESDGRWRHRDAWARAARMRVVTRRRAPSWRLVGTVEASRACGRLGARSSSPLRLGRAAGMISFWPM